jgi:hemoglobin
MKIPAIIVACVLGVSAMTEVGAQPMPAAASQAAPSLYKRLGGYDALAAVTDDFLQRLVGDPQFARFFGATARTR